MLKIKLNDVGTRIIVDTGVDISDVVSVSMWVKKPNGLIQEWDVEVSEITKIQHIVEYGELDVKGKYYIQASVEWVDKSIKTETLILDVYQIIPKDLILYPGIVQHPTLPIGIIAYYPFEDTASDATENGNDGEIIGSPGFVDGKVGSTVDFDGTPGQKIDLGNTHNLQPAFTISFWLYIPEDAPSSGTAILYGKEDQWGVHYSYGTKIIYFWLYNTYGEYFEVSASYNPGSYAHVVCVYDGSYIYVNGFRVTMPVPATGNIPETSNNCIIGEGLVGSVDELGIWEKALTESEILNLNNNGSGIWYNAVAPKVIAFSVESPVLGIVTFDIPMAPNAYILNPDNYRVEGLGIVDPDVVGVSISINGRCANLVLDGTADRAYDYIVYVGDI